MDLRPISDLLIANILMTLHILQSASGFFALCICHKTSFFLSDIFR